MESLMTLYLVIRGNGFKNDFKLLKETFRSGILKKVIDFQIP